MFPQVSGTSLSPKPRSIAFVDNGISDANSLIEGLSEHHVIQLPTATNGIETITQALSKYNNLDSIHIFSHGDNGSLQLGNVTLSQAFLNEYQNDLKDWGQALTREGDLLFYGCNFAADGDQFIEHISQTTGADVAASNDLTGKDGDWQLEVTTGNIETNLAVENYQGTLARIQAETGTFTGSASSTNIHNGFDGAGFVGYLTTPGSGVELNTTAIAGSYDLNIRYAAGVNGPAANRSVSLLVNDTDVGQFSFDRTGSWENWATLSTAVDLQAGNNTLEFRVDSDDTGYINIDYIDLDLANNNPGNPTSERIQAEAGTFTGSAASTDIHGGFDGNGFVGWLTTPGSSVELTPDAIAGTYDLNIRYAAGVNGANSNRSVSLVVNGTDVGQLSFPRTGSWENWATLATTVDLQTGNNTIEFRVDGDDTGYINVDYIDLAETNTSSGVATAARIQAETGTFSGRAASTDIHGGFDGNGFVGWLTTPGSSVELTPDVAAGTYDLNIRYAAGVNGANSNRSVSLVVNGTNVGQLSFPRTGSWENWDTLATTVDLQAGNNTIEFRVEGNDTGYINIDYIDLFPAGTSGPQIIQSPTPSSYQLNLTTFATHSEFQSGGGSNPTGTASAFGAIDVTAPRDGSGRVFVSSQTGKILGYDQNGNSLGTLLDLASIASTTGFINGEGAGAFRGLMYFDFHPDFNNAGTAGYRKVYAGYQVLSSFDNGGANADYRIQNYNNRAGDNQYAIGEWTVSNTNLNTVEPGSFREVFRVQMEGNNPHGLGEIAFNPNSNPGDADYGLLYAAIGDANAFGNSAPAPGYLQDLDNPFGKIVRINPLQNGSESYSIPDSNPFVGQPGAAEEIYAVGFRDPQTFSFGKDSAGEDVLITFDIGASQREEISLVRSGGNYGWGRFEGTRLNDSSEPLAPGTVHSPPVLEYDHTTGGFAIIGGLRVTDPNNPNFVDKVLFSDLPTGKLFYADYQALVQAELTGTQARFFEINTFTKDGVTVTENAGGGGTNPGVTFEDVISRSRGDARFGTDELGNVYIVTKQAGNIFRTGLIRV